MEFKKIFDDKDSKSLFKQIEDAQSYLYKELDKHINKELLLRVLEINLLPVLIYPERENQYIMPISYSKGLHQVNIHMPKPEVKLFSVKEYVEFFGLDETDSFYEQIVLMKDRVEKNEW